MSQARDIVAVFEIDKFIVKYDCGPHGTRDGGGELEQCVEYGSSAEDPVVKVEDGWRFMGWSEDTTSVISNMLVTALYERIYHSVVMVDRNGRETVANVEYGSSIAFSAPATEYDASGLISYACQGSSYTKPIITNAFEVCITNPIRVAWDMWTTNYWLQVNASDNGTLIGPQTGWFVKDSIQSFIASPDSHYHFTKWADSVRENERDGASANVVMDMPRVVDALFEIDCFRVQFKIDECGYTDDPNTNQVVSYGSAAIEPTLIANESWRFDHWDQDFSCVTNDLQPNAIFRTYEAREVLGNAFVSGTTCTTPSAKVYGYSDPTYTTSDVVKLTAEDNAKSWVSLNTNAIFRIEYDWRASCEPMMKGKLWDYLMLSVDGEEVRTICGESGWQHESVEVTNDCEHAIVWCYRKDESDAEGEDCGVVANVVLVKGTRVVFSPIGDETGNAPLPQIVFEDGLLAIPGKGTLIKLMHTFEGWSDGLRVWREGDLYPGNGATNVLTATWQRNELPAPTIHAPDYYETESAEVTIEGGDCDEIYYTIDGSAPTKSSLLYDGPFLIHGSATIKAFCCRDDYFDSVVVEAVVKRGPWTFGEYLNCTNLVFETSGNAEWQRAKNVDGSIDGYSLVSGEISHNETSILKTRVVCAGDISFRCKISSEAFKQTVYDGLRFKIDDSEMCWIGGEKDWTNITISVHGSGTHDLEWSYVKDAGDDKPAMYDCVWIDSVSWKVKEIVVPQEITGSKQINIDPLWIHEGKFSYTRFTELYGDDLQTAVLMPTTKSGSRAGNSYVWQDYVAGTDPTDSNSVFTASIRVVDGVPVVTWDPDLKTERSYNIWGRDELNDTKGWVCPTNSTHHFFRVTVETH